MRKPEQKAALKSSARKKPQLCIGDGGILSESLDAPASLNLEVQRAKLPAGLRGAGPSPRAWGAQPHTAYSRTRAWGAQPQDFAHALLS